jgi:hypothetical protein
MEPPESKTPKLGLALKPETGTPAGKRLAGQDPVEAAAQGPGHYAISGPLANATVSFVQWPTPPALDRFPGAFLRQKCCLLVSGIVVLAVGLASVASAGVPYDFTAPLFGLAVAPDGSLLVADAGAGIVELRKGAGALIAELPGVTDVAPIGGGVMYATRGGPGGALFRVSRGATRQVVDLNAFEADVNPDGGEILSNPFDVAVLSGGEALVAAAAANAILTVDSSGRVDWVATLPTELVSTANIKSLAGCPTAPPQFASVCEFPAMLPAQGVPTSVAIGPDGAYYVGELKGFPAPTGASRVWRIEPGTRQATCGSSSAC